MFKNHNSIKSFLPNKKNLFIWMNTCVMLTGLLLFDWRPVMIVFAYVFETIVIGIIHAFKLWAVHCYGVKQKSVPISKDPREMNGFSIIPFFIVHYFFFIFVQSVFIFSFMGKSVSGISNDSFNVIGNYAFLLSQQDLMMAFVCIGLANVGYAMRNFFIPKKYDDFTLSQLFMQPYIRVIIQQLVSILAGFVFFFSNGGIAVALVLIIVRTGMDLYLSAVKNNPVIRTNLLNRMNQNGKLKSTVITNEHIDLFIE